MAQTGNNYEKWLRGDNTVNIQGRIMVLVHSTSSHCHLSIYQICFNGNSSFKVICRTKPWRTDGQSGDYILSPSRSI